MIRQRFVAAVGAAALSVATLGCPSGPKQETIVVKGPGAIQQAKSLLENYAKGQPLGSESTGFASMVADVRKEDPAKADVLEKGLKDLESSKGNRAAIAKELLGKL